MSSSATGLDWRALMQLGLTGLRLKPDEFWALSPVELRLMVGVDGAGPMARSGLNDLMAAYPDTETGDADDRDV